MFQSHMASGTGIVFVRTREEMRLLLLGLQELGRDVKVAACVSPNGSLIGYSLRNGQIIAEQKPIIAAAPGQSTLPKALAWTGEKAGRATFFWDNHMLINNPGNWRTIIEALPNLRVPPGSEQDEGGSLAIFVGPQWELSANNPLRGAVPILDLETPSRDDLREQASKLRALPAGEDGERVLDALSGLAADVAEQAAAETISRCGDWDITHLRGAQKAALKDSGLEIWDPVEHLGGLAPLKTFAEEEVMPWVRDAQLGIRRILCAGVPGVGKSFWPRWLAHRLGCLCVRFSVSRLMHGIVGSSEANLRRVTGAIDALGDQAPVVVVVDEIEKVFQVDGGNDGGTSARMGAEFLTWLQESRSQAIVVATLNRLDKLDAALESRFAARWFFDLPKSEERKQVATIWFHNLGYQDCEKAAEELAVHTEGFSNREIAQGLIPTILRRTNRRPTCEDVKRIIDMKEIVPTGTTQEAQLRDMRRAAESLRRANSDGTETVQTGRRVRRSS